MTRWFRFYEDTLHDSKVLRLSDEMYRAWTILLCFASKNSGFLPPADDIAVALRVKPAKVCEWITKLVRCELIDHIGNDFAPHNWEGRQYKSDVSTERVKRFRNAKRNVSPAVSETPPETEQIQITEQRQKDAEPSGSGAGAPIDARADLFGRGLETLARLTGKGPDACRSFVGKCLKAASDDAVTVLGLIEDAERNRVVDPSAWISSRLKATGPPASAKPMSVHQAKHAEGRAILNELHEFNTRTIGREDTGVLRQHSGDGTESVHGGSGGNLIELSTDGSRSRG